VLGREEIGVGMNEAWLRKTRSGLRDTSTVEKSGENGPSIVLRIALSRLRDIETTSVELSSSCRCRLVLFVLLARAMFLRPL